MRYTKEGEPGTIVVPTNHLGRYSEFELSLERVVVPQDTSLVRARSGSSAHNLNVGVSQRQGAWVWIIGDDHTFQPDIIMRLLDRKVDVVAPLCPMRYPPYGLVLYKKLDMMEQNGKVSDFAEAFYSLEELGGVRGMVPVQGLPQAGLLVREAVWAQLPMPIFKIGRIHPDEIEDDKYFMWELRERYKQTLWCDTDQAIAHLTTMAISCSRTASGKYTHSIAVA